MASGLLIVALLFALSALATAGIFASAEDERRREESASEEGSSAPPMLGLGALALVLGLLIATGCPGSEPAPAPAPPAPPTEVQAARATGDLAATNAGAAAWDEAAEMVVALEPQDVTEPKLLEAGVGAIRVRALASASHLIFRLEWDDATEDDVEGVSRFSDAVAIQLPIAGGGDVPDAQMGQRGRPVRIRVWKAAWQAHPEEAAARLAALHPNAPAADHYPPEAAGSEEDRAAMEVRYAPARAAGRTLAAAPVQDFVAEGFGTLTAQPESTAFGSGAHEGGVWRVTIGVPMGSTPAEALCPGRRTYVAFAVWDGAAGNVGARKMRSGWVPLVLPEMEARG